MLDVTIADLIDFFGAATDTQSIIVYIESITEAREFVSAARAFARTKPIVAYKAGRFAQSAAAAASHTGAMAGVDSVYAAAFQRAGIERIFEIEDMFDCAELLARHQPPKGDRLAIVTNAGGPGVMTTDHLLSRDGKSGHALRGHDGQAQRLSAHLLVAQQPRGHPRRRPAGALCQDRGHRPPGRGGRRGAGDPDAAGDDRPDRLRAVADSRRGPEHQAGAGGLDGRGDGGRGDAALEPGRHSQLRYAGEGRPRLHAPGVLRPQPGLPPRNAAANPPGLRHGSAARAGTVRHDPQRRPRRPLGERLQDAVGRLRDPGHQAGDGPHPRGRRGGGAADGLPRGDEDPLAADHAQDRRGRRDSQPRLRTRPCSAPTTR